MLLSKGEFNPIEIKQEIFLLQKWVKCLIFIKNFPLFMDLLREQREEIRFSESQSCILTSNSGHLSLLYTL